MTVIAGIFPFGMIRDITTLGWSYGWGWRKRYRHYKKYRWLPGLTETQNAQANPAAG